MTAKPLCIYHGNCADGFGAAWAVQHAVGSDYEYVAGHYGSPPPEYDGRDVILLDFSYKRDVVLDMLKTARSVKIYDHHKTAQEELWPLLDSGAIHGIIDMSRSGAVIAWREFHPNAPTPRLLLHIQDRDLWRFAMNDTRDIMEAVFSHPYDFAVWDELVLRTSTERLLQDGRPIARKKRKDILELIDRGVRWFKFTEEDLAVPTINVPYIYGSDACDEMLRCYPEAPFAASYSDGPNKRNWSLRGRPNGVDVSAIAALYGGGGHRSAAGFAVDHDADLGEQPTRVYVDQG